MRKTSVFALGLAAALGLGAAAPAMARDHDHRWNNNGAIAAAAAPGAATGWYSGPNPNWVPPQATYNGETHYLREHNGRVYYSNSGYAPYGYYQRDNGDAVGAAVLGAVLGGVVGYNLGH